MIFWCSVYFASALITAAKPWSAADAVVKGGTPSVIQYGGGVVPNGGGGNSKGR